VLIVDEAHGLSPSVLEEIRLLCNFESDTAKQLQIVLTGQPELRDVLNFPELRQLKQRVALRCELKALPNVEETAQYISSRLKVAGADRLDIFSPGAVDYIFRCTAGIPRAVNNLCDNALLNGFAAGDQIISKAMIQEVAETFDVLPRIAKVEEREAPSRIFPAASRAELWSAGNAGNGNGHGNGNGNGNSNYSNSDSEFIAISPAAEPDIIFHEHTRQNDSQTSLDDLGAAFSRSGLGRRTNGKNL
jgi:general secretion pathway protein A